MDRRAPSSRMPGEGVEPSGNRSAVGHISRSVTPAVALPNRGGVIETFEETAPSSHTKCAVKRFSPSEHARAANARTPSYVNAALPPCVRLSSDKLLVWTALFSPQFPSGGSRLESETEQEQGPAEASPTETVPRKRPWGRITAVLGVALGAITAVALSLRPPKPAPTNGPG